VDNEIFTKIEESLHTKHLKGPLNCLSFKSPPLDFTSNYPKSLGLWIRGPGLHARNKSGYEVKKFLVLQSVLQVLHVVSCELINLF